MVAKKYFTEEERREAKKRWARDYYQKYKEKLDEDNRERKRRYYHANKEIIAKKIANQFQIDRVERPRRYLFQRAKSNGRTSGREVSITLDDIIIPEKCPYLNIPLTCTVTSKRTHSNISIDRIDSAKGYIKGNVQVISFLANLMKSNATEEQLIAFAKGVLRIHAGIDVDQISSECRELQ